MLSQNYDLVRQKVDEAAKKAGRNPEDVTLIAVSKTKPIPMLTEIYEHGCRHFGENKVQELVDKYEALPKDIKWHMIGHLQTNKVKYIVDKVHLIHSVDSVRLAAEISKQAVKKNVTVDILVEVNVANEATKFGLMVDEVYEMIMEIAKFPNIQIKGLMTIAPYVVDSEENRAIFHILKQLSVDIMQKNIDNVSVDVLSMGMTGDYEVATQEGATLVRVGTGIFGERDYSVSSNNT